MENNPTGNIGRVNGTSAAKPDVYLRKTRPVRAGSSEE